jgi:hypothetical protein
MKILFNDIIQFSDAPTVLKSPALTDMYTYILPINVTFNKQYKINCFGIGNTDATEAVLTFNDVDTTTTTLQLSGSGLYSFPKTVIASQVSITLNAIFVSRIGMGNAIKLGTAIAKEPGFNSTFEPRTTLSGQVVEGAGGYVYRTISVDTRYKLSIEALEEIQAGYQSQIARGFPFFISFDEEQYRIPFMPRLYATEKNQRSMSFESGINKPLFSRRFQFEEAF